MQPFQGEVSRIWHTGVPIFSSQWNGLQKDAEDPLLDYYVGKSLKILKIGARQRNELQKDAEDAMLGNCMWPEPRISLSV